MLKRFVFLFAAISLVFADNETSSYEEQDGRTIEFASYLGGRLYAEELGVFCEARRWF